MQYAAAAIKSLIKTAMEQFRFPMDTYGFRELSKEVSKDIDASINDRYYYKLLKEAQNAIKEGAATVGARESHVNALLQLMGYRSFEAYQKGEKIPIADNLEACVGCWYSVARANSGITKVLFAPVEIWRGTDRYHIKLQGGARLFQGEVRRKGDTIYCHLDSDADKTLQLVMRIGASIRPQVLSGVFAGISSGGAPIGGRELLIRAGSNDFAQLEPVALPLKDPDQWPDWVDRRIHAYFLSYPKNCVKASESSTYTFDDLDIGEE